MFAYEFQEMFNIHFNYLINPKQIHMSDRFDSIQIINRKYRGSTPIQQPLVSPIQALPIITSEISSQPIPTNTVRTQPLPLISNTHNKNQIHPLPNFQVSDQTKMTASSVGAAHQSAMISSIESTRIKRYPSGDITSEERSDSPWWVWLIGGFILFLVLGAIIIGFSGRQKKVQLQRVQQSKQKQDVSVENVTPTISEQEQMQRQMKTKSQGDSLEGSYPQPKLQSQQIPQQSPPGGSSQQFQQPQRDSDTPPNNLQQKPQTQQNNQPNNSSPPPESLSMNAPEPQPNLNPQNHRSQLNRDHNDSQSEQHEKERREPSEKQNEQNEDRSQKRQFSHLRHMVRS